MIFTSWQCQKEELGEGSGGIGTVVTVLNCNVSCHRVSLKHTLKKKGFALRNIGTIYFPDHEISLALFQNICSTICC